MTGPLDARVVLPGSKSITNRAMVLAALAQGRSVLESVLLSDDTRYMSDALRVMGFTVEIDEPARRITVSGRGGTIPAHGGDIFVGGAGTVMRFIVAMVTLGEGRFRVDGNQRMRQRPIGPQLDAMQRLGASVYSERDNNCPPVIVDASRARFEGGETSVDARASSQFVSAMLMPAPIWKAGLKLRVIGDTARPFIDMTLRLMEAWGAHSTVEGEMIVVPGGQWYRAQRFVVEPDASSASYFAAAAALVGGTRANRGPDFELGAGRPRLSRRAAADGRARRVASRLCRGRGTGKLTGVDVAMNSMPDMVATLAAIAPFASSPTIIRNVAFIRHHESDRIRALATELRRLGATVVEHDDGLEIAPSAMHPAAIETYDDHRIAMSFAVTGLKLGGVKIKQPGCVAKTFPDFFDRLAALTR